MTLSEREAGELISAVENACKNIDELRADFKQFYEKHNDVHDAISRQLGGLYIITAVLLLAFGAALTKLLGG